MDRSRLWRQRDFALVWAGQTVSETGSQITMLALPLVAIDVLKVGTVAVGALSACATLAFLVAGLPAGALVDRMRKRRVMIVADVGRALVLASVPVAYLAGALSIVQLCVVALAAGLLTVFFEVAYQSYLPALVGPDALVDANGKLQATASAAQVGGPAAGGALVGLLGPAGAVALDAASFLVSIATLASVRVPEAVAERAEQRSLRRDIGEGLRYVLSEPRIRSVAAATATSNVFSALGEVALLVFLRRSMHLSPTVIGFLFAAGCVGGILGAVAAAPLARLLGVGRAILATIAVSGVGILLFPVATRSDVVVVVVVGQFLNAFGAVAYNVNQVSMRQAICPPALIGRMTASVRTVVWGIMPIGSLAGGALGATIGLRPTLWVAGAGGVLAFGWIAASPGVRRVREMPTAPPQEVALEAPVHPVP